jgi:ATP-dependent DNA helicase PIF1
LSAEQKTVVKTVLSGVNVFFTGSAGTGKSLVLRRIVGMLPAETTFVTAATGLRLVLCSAGNHDV